MGSITDCLKKKNKTFSELDKKKVIKKFLVPPIRHELALALSPYVKSCIDISDGLFSDLSHILECSKVGADIKLNDIPYSKTLLKLNKDLAIELALTGGDDYELCFTVPPNLSDSNLEKMITTSKFCKIGRINQLSSKLNLIDDDEKIYDLKSVGYRHF